MFPLSRIDDIQKSPENFKLIERLPSFIDRPDIYQSNACDWSKFDAKDIVFISLVDTETTGLNSLTDEIIEFGFVNLAYHKPTGHFFVEASGSMLRKPSQPIPDLITSITGITNEDVEGHSFEPKNVYRVLCDADIIIAHNAKFDFGFIDAFLRSGGFDLKAKWACSLSDINWREKGFESKALGYILSQYGFFFEGHRAVDDCFATLAALKLTEGAFDTLFLASDSSLVDVRVVISPYECKDQLKALGCQWDAGRKEWHKRVNAENQQETVDAILSVSDVISVSVDAIPECRFA